MKSPLRKLGQGLETLERRDLLTSVPFGASSQDTAEFLLGDVTVNVVLLESNGAIDANVHNWTPDKVAEVKSSVEEGVLWWSDTIKQYSDVHELDFKFDYTYLDNPVSTSYEPIERKSQDFDLWIEDFYRKVGVAPASGFSQEIRNFNHQKRIEHETNWSFTIFVVNSNDGQTFASGSNFSRAFAYTGGRFMVMPYYRPAATVAHELAHIFWAHDEYRNSDSYTERRGYYGTQNTNAVDGNPSPGPYESSILVTTTTSANGPFVNHRVSESGRETMGWRDSDGDGIFDVLDVDHSLSGSITFDAESRTAQFVGSSSVQTLNNRNTSGTGNDITINRITDLQFRLDGGAWQDLVEFDDYRVTIDATTAAIPVGMTSIEFRTIDDRIGVASNVISTTFEADSQTEKNLLPFQNPTNRFDVSGDGHVSPVDVLRLIVAINDGITPVQDKPPYLDVSGDGFVTPRDALLVISYINDQSEAFDASKETVATGQTTTTRRTRSVTPSGQTTSSAVKATSAKEAVYALLGSQGEADDDDNDFWL